MTRAARRAKLTVSLLVLVLGGLAACGDDDTNLVVSEPPANVVVRQRIESLAPAANLGHRGAGVNRPGHPFPENSIASFLEAMAQGADGIELDVELTADAELVIMHDDTLDRTTTCTGCVSEHTLEAVRQCFLVDGDGRVSDERPPTLAEVYQALPPAALVNLELKVFEPPCLTATAGPRALARAAVDAVERLQAAERTLFSSFNEEAAAAVKQERADLYSALLFSGFRGDPVARALELGLDAIHPLFLVGPDRVRAALDAGLQVNVWTVNTAEAMNQNLEKGVTAIITDEPAVLVEVLATRH